MPERSRPGGAEPGWVSIALLLAVIRRLNRAWRKLPPRVAHQWGAEIAAGFAATLLVTLAAVRLTRWTEAAGLLGWEPGVLRWLDTRAPLSFNTAMWIEAPANGFVLWALVLYAAGVAAWRGRALRSVALLVGHTLVYVPILLGWLLWDRDRPTLVAEGLGTPPGFNSFPSGHLVQAVFVYGFLLALWADASRRAGERAFAAICFAGVLALVCVRRLRGLTIRVITPIFVA